jgi:hypothetical protein
MSACCQKIPLQDEVGMDGWLTQEDARLFGNIQGENIRERSGSSNLPLFKGRSQSFLPKASANPLRADIQQVPYPH